MEKAKVITNPHSVEIVSLHNGGLERGIAELIKKGGEVLRRTLAIDRSCFMRNFNNVDNVMASLAANLDALIAVDGITHAKMRHTANRTAQQIDYLSLVVAIVTALHGSCHEVRALGYSVEGHVLEAAKRVVARPLPPLNKGTVAVEAYTSKGVRVEPIGKALKEWLQKPKGGMLAKPEYDADALFFAIASLAPNKEVAAVSLDRDLLTASRDLVTPGKDKKVLNQFRNPFFASEPAASIYLLYNICCGSDFCEPLANCRRGCTRDKFVKVTELVEAHCVALCTKPETKPWPLDLLLEKLEIPKAARPMVVAILKLYVDGPLFSRDGNVVRIGDFVCAEAKSQLALSLNAKRLAWIAASGYNSTVEAVLRRAWTPEVLPLLKALTEELMSRATPKNAGKASERAKALLPSLRDVRETLGRACGASLLEGLAALDKDLASLQDTREIELLDDHGDGRPAEEALRRFEKRIAEMKRRLTELKRRAEQEARRAEQEARHLAWLEKCRADQEAHHLAWVESEVSAKMSVVLDEVERRAAEAERRAAAEAEQRAAAKAEARAKMNQNRVDAARKQGARQRADRAAQTDGADEAVDSVARWTAAVARTSPAGPSRNQCEMVDREASMLTRPENAGEAPVLESCQNFTRNPIPRKKGVGANCSMCGCANKGTLTSPNVEGVHIAGQMKDVCGHCIGAVWRHVATGSYLRFCKGCKNFRHVHEFALGDGDRMSLNPFKTAKCAVCRAKGRGSGARKRSRE